MQVAHLLIISRLPAVAISGARRICTKMSLLLFTKLHPLIQMSIKNRILFQTLEVAWLSSPPSSTNSTNCEFRLIAEPEYSSAEMAESPSKASLIEPLLAVYKREIEVFFDVFGWLCDLIYQVYLNGGESSDGTFPSKVRVSTVSESLEGIRFHRKSA